MPETPADLLAWCLERDPGIVLPLSEREQKLAEHWWIYGIRDAVHRLGLTPEETE